METEFALPDRADARELAKDIEAVKDLALVRELTELLPDAFVILNFYRQIVYGNPALVKLLGLAGPEAVYGLRPGEALNCIHAEETEGGCGTTQFCKYCGAVNAILDSQETPGTPAQRECRLTVGQETQSFDFNVRASTLSLLDRHFTLVVVQDIGAEKRRQILERLFFHDILNTAGGIQGLIELMREATEEEMAEFLALAASSTDTLVEEIHAQRQLLAAEKGELIIEPYQLNARELVDQVQQHYRRHPVAENKTITVDPETSTSDFLSDPRLLKRILGNMVKNALEAEEEGARILMGADLSPEKGEIEFWVSNSTAMSEEARMQVFQRSFSTKGNGRGLGTYSIKLLGETYLKGKVGFSCHEDQGTRFHIRLPLGI